MPISARHATLEAIIIRSAHAREADKIMTAYTANGGKIAFVAKGSRKTSGRILGRIDPFNHVEIDLVDARGLPILTGASIVNRHEKIKSDLGITTRGYVGLELLNKLTPENDPDPNIFQLLRGWLAILSQPTGASEYNQADRLLWGFVAKLLSRLGQYPDLAACTGCGKKIKKDSADQYFIDEWFEGAVGKGCVAERGVQATKLSHAQRTVLKFLPAASWGQILSLELTVEQHREVQDIITALILAHTNTPLKSFALLESLPAEHV